MRGLASAAAAIAAAATGSHHPDPPLVALDYGEVHYDISAVNDGAGLGGSPPYCAGVGSDLVMVTYRVTNRGGRDLPAIAVPRIQLIDPEGRAHPRDAVLSNMVEKKALPLLSYPHERLGAGRSAIQADVFVTPTGAARQGVWTLQPATSAAMSRRMPPAKAVLSGDCPTRTPPLNMPPQPEADAPAPAPEPPQ